MLLSFLHGWEMECVLILGPYAIFSSSSIFTTGSNDAPTYYYYTKIKNTPILDTAYCLIFFYYYIGEVQSQIILLEVISALRKEEAFLIHKVVTKKYNK